MDNSSPPPYSLEESEIQNPEIDFLKNEKFMRALKLLIFHFTVTLFLSTFPILWWSELFFLMVVFNMIILIFLSTQKTPMIVLAMIFVILKFLTIIIFPFGQDYNYDPRFDDRISGTMQKIVTTCYLFSSMLQFWLAVRIFKIVKQRGN